MSSADETGSQARRHAAEAVLAASRALENARVAIEDMRRAAREVMQAELAPDRLAELDQFLDGYTAPTAPATTAYLEGIRSAFTGYCAEHLTLAEIEGFAALQHTPRFQTLAADLSAAVKAPLTAYQMDLVHEINARFR